MLAILPCHEGEQGLSHAVRQAAGCAGREIGLQVLSIDLLAVTVLATKRKVAVRCR